MDFLERLYGDAVNLAGKVIDAQARPAGDLTGGEQPQYGVDEYGRAYLRGTPSAPGGIDSRLLIVAGVAAIALVVVVVLAKN